MGTARAQPRCDPGLHRISAVARSTGVSEHALRIWERRYGSFASKRSAGGYRLYTDADIERISSTKRLLDLGYSIGEVAKLGPAQLKDRLDRERPSHGDRPDAGFADSMRARFLAAIEKLDLQEASSVAAACAHALTPFELVAEVIGPVLTEIGLRWERGRLSIAQEHAASTLLRDQLGEVFRRAKPGPNAKVIVSTTPSGERHEFGALMAAIVASGAGARIIYLGPELPPNELAAAVKASGAEVVMLSAVCLAEPALSQRLRAIRRAVPAQVDIWVGGAAVRESPSGGFTWVRTLEELQLLASA